MSPWGVFLVALAASVTAEVPSDSPKCNAANDVTLKKAFPDPLPIDLLGETSKLGPWSILTVTAPNLPLLKAQQEVCTNYHVLNDKKSVTSLRKMVPGALSQTFTIVEKDDKFEITSVSNPKNSFTAYAIYFKDGVSVVSKCCKECTGDGYNLAVAIADCKKEDPAAHQAVMEVRKKLNSIKLDVNIGELASCVETVA